MLERYNKKGADRSRRPGNYRADEEAPAQGNNPGLHNFFWTGVRMAMGEAPGSAPKNVAGDRPVPLRRSELQILWHGCHA